MRRNSSLERGMSPGSGMPGRNGGRGAAAWPNIRPPPGGRSSPGASMGSGISLPPARAGPASEYTTTALLASPSVEPFASAALAPGMPTVSLRKAFSFGWRLPVVPSGSSSPPPLSFVSRTEGTPTAGRILLKSGSALVGQSEMWWPCWPQR